MKPRFKVLDVFAGPGGLAEGFASVRRDGRPAFEIALSVEKDPAAFQTLRLRSFTRQFERIPDDYYRFMAGGISLDRLISAWPEEWRAASGETLRLELASPGADAIIDPLIDTLRAEANDRAILVGGPPCQAYSLAGRARNKGIADYVASEDHRHFLYREYIRLIGRLRPAAFVMENVKGFLSSSIEGELIFEQVVADLARAGGAENSYILVPLAPGTRKTGSRYIVEAEEFGVPQKRHRVILFGVRSDLVTDAHALARIKELARLSPAPAPSVRQVIGSMPKVRSGISRRKDSPEAWRAVVLEALHEAAAAAFAEEDEELDAVAERLGALADALRVSEDEALPRRGTAAASVESKSLSDWLVDGRLRAMANHESRSHMAGDLARYAFAACFAEATGRSPRARHFPTGLAPDHQSWNKGKFNDRFRVQCWNEASTTVTSHISKDGHYFIHPDPAQCRSLTVREAARLQTFPDNYLFLGNRTEQYVQVGNAVPPLLAHQIAEVVLEVLTALASDEPAASEADDPAENEQEQLAHLQRSAA